MLAIHRITNAEKLNEQSKRLEKFSLHDYASSSVFGFNNNGLIDLKLKFTQEAGQHLFETPLNDTQTIEETNDGKILVHAKISDNAQLKWWILGFGGQVEVIEPDSLRQDISNICKSLLKIYEAD